MIRRNLLDVNALVALTSNEHPQYPKAQRWFDSLADQEWDLPFDRSGIRPGRYESGERPDS